MRKPDSFWMDTLVVATAIALIFCALIFSLPAKAGQDISQLIIVHPGTQEVMIGEILEVEESETQGYLRYRWHEYESFWFDRIMVDGFELPEGTDTRKRWDVDLELWRPGPIYSFTYHCASYVQEHQIVLFCAD